MAISFNGVTRTITLDASPSVSATEIYSRWKDWQQLSDNTKFLPAFSVVGGDPISPDAALAVNVFVRNDLGWRIAPPEQDIDIVITGNLYPSNPTLPWRGSPTGDFQTSINTETSVNAVVVTVDSGSGGGGGGGFTAGQFWP